MKFKRCFLFLAALAMAGDLPAAIFAEISDAGETLAGAQTVPGPGPYPLTGITGVLTSRDADLFRIYLSGTPFSASTVSDETSFFDTQLFLFDSLGRGVFANDDDPALPPQSTITSPLNLSAGWYFLGISAFGYDAASSAGLIFPPVDNFLVLSTDLRTATGPGGAFALSNFEGTSSEEGAYSVSLAGVQTVPEPSYSAILLFMCGCMILAARERGRKRC